MPKLRSLTGVARRPWYAWLELQYRLADEIITHTLGFDSKKLEEVPSVIREQRNNHKLYEIIKFFYNQLESESGDDLTDEPLFAIAAGHNVRLAHILGSVCGKFYGEQNISQKIWNGDLEAVMAAISAAREWFLWHDRESETADSKRGKAVKAGATAGGRSRCIPLETKIQAARGFQAAVEKLMQDDKWLKRTQAIVQVGRENGKSGKTIQRYLKLLTQE